jgi:hypothetical protein
MKEQVRPSEARRSQDDPYGAAARAADELARLLEGLGDSAGAAAATREARQALAAAYQARAREDRRKADLY